MDRFKELLGRIHCFFGFHKSKRLGVNSGVADGFSCSRKDCKWKIDPIVWPQLRKEASVEKSKIIDVVKRLDGKPIIFSPSTRRVLGRQVLKWSSHCGTYGQGGPGFFGLCLEATGKYSEEWLILRLWGASDWLNVNGQWLSASPDQYNGTNKPLYSNYHMATWDMFAPLIIGKKITGFDIKQRMFDIEVGDAKIKLTEEPTTRPIYYGSKEPRILTSDDDLRKAWIIAPAPWVRI